MANMDVGTPRFYTDIPSYLMSRGLAQDGNFDVKATGGSGSTASRGIQTGTEAELFDMNPLNKVDFDTSGDTDSQVLITIDTQGATTKSFVAILNHNTDAADAKIRINASDTEAHVTAVDMGSATLSPDCTNVVNGAASTNIITPGADGSTIVTFAESTLRYWGIQFEGDSSNTFGSTDLFVGCILIGEYFDMPNSPNMAVTRRISFDGLNTVQQSEGGQRYSNLRSYGRTASSTSKSPFTTASNGYDTYGGRIVYDVSFSFLSSANLMPDEYRTVSVDDNFVSDVWNKTNGSHLPFIFSVDKGSTGADAESEHIFARFANNSLDMTQVSHKLWDISLAIEEEF